MSEKQEKYQRVVPILPAFSIFRTSEKVFRTISPLIENPESVQIRSVEKAVPIVPSEFSALSVEFADPHRMTESKHKRSEEKAVPILPFVFSSEIGPRKNDTVHPEQSPVQKAAWSVDRKESEEKHVLILPSPKLASIDVADPQVMTEKELSTIEENMSFSAISEETKPTIHEECRHMLTGPFMQQKVCAVCDSWTRESVCQLQEPSEDLYARCQSRLCPSIDIPEVLKHFYNISMYIPELRNALLSKKRG